MNKGSKQTEEALQKIREARARQGSSHLLRRGITKEQQDAAHAAGLRWCTGHKSFVPRDTFYSDKIGASCAECTKKAVAKRRAAYSDHERVESANSTWAWRDKNAENVRRYHLQSKYQVSPEWYEAKMAEQGGHCALCPQTIVKGRKFLFVDHNHGCCAGKNTCGKCIRGILCYRCNTFLGQLELPGWLDGALAYLARYA